MPTAGKNKIRVLFVCTGNSCRSQIAEGLLRELGSGDFEVHSAGTHPWALHPLALIAMAERGIDISRQYSKSIEQYRDEVFDYVVTLSDAAKDYWPTYTDEERTTHWNVRDPVDAEGTLEERMKVFREVRDELERRVKQWLSELKKRSGKG